MKYILALGASIALAADAFACDLCGCYTPQLQVETMPEGPMSGVYAGVGEQFTHFGTLQFEGHEVPDPARQYLDSSITQVVAGYSITDRVGVQLSLPIIARNFKRPEGFAIEHGSENGIGDMSLLLQFVAWRYSAGARRSFDLTGKNPVAIEHEPDFTASVILLAGLKLPTGATARLKEEFNEVSIPGAPPSGIHGHDLTLGTGSYDGLFGLRGSARYRDLFFEATTQFTLRGDGAHQYHFANDLIWGGGPGYYVVRNRSTAVGVECVVAGEYKDVDRFRGAAAEDTGITSVFVGPRVVASHGRWSADIDVELPASIDNTSLQLVPDYRIRGGISYQF